MEWWRIIPDAIPGLASLRSMHSAHSRYIVLQNLNGQSEYVRGFLVALMAKTIHWNFISCKMTIFSVGFMLEKSTAFL